MIPTSMPTDTATAVTQALDPLRFPLYGSRLIEASAGTGKTYTIALLYVRLVLAHGGGNALGRPLTPPEILVVTFTDAATQELRERIRARLSEAAACFSTPLDDNEGHEEGGDTANAERKGPAHDPALLALRADYPPAAWPGCARLLSMAAQWMDEAAVSTIHGWCYRMLREHAFDSGSLFTQELITDESALLEAAVHDYWRRTYYPLPAADVAEVLRCFADPAALRRQIEPLLARGDALLAWGGQVIGGPGPIAEETSPARLLAGLQGWNDTAETLTLKVRETWTQPGGADSVRQWLHTLRPDLNARSFPERKDDAAFDAWLQALADWAHTGQGDPQSLRLERLAPQRLQLNGKKPVPEHPLLQPLADWFDHGQSRPDVRAALLLHALAGIRANLAEDKSRRAELGFNDLLVRLDVALQGAQGDRLALAIRHQFPVALIDEFQDTDPLQYRIFDRIYDVAGNDAATGLFMIGDPKQAIYAFRGADIHTYLQARAATAGRHYTLATNFRSTRAVVEAVNHAFAYAETHHPRGAFRFAEPDGRNPVPFVPVQAQGRRESLLIDGAEVPALNVWMLENPVDPLLPVGATMYREQMAERSASAVRDWLALASEGRAGYASDEAGALPRVQRALRPADIAILVRGRAEAEAVRSALARRRLASVYLSDRDSVFDTPEAQDLLRWLQACVEPGHDGRLRAALATRTMGLAWAELDRLNEDEQHWETLVLRVHGYKLIWQKQGVLPMLRRWLSDFDLPERLRALPDGERSLTNVLHLSEWLQRQSAELDGEHALVRAFSEELAQPGAEEILRLESDADLIKVITVHKSKGLEYPLVLLPYICAWKDVDGRSASLGYHQSPQDASGGPGAYVVELSRDKVLAGTAYERANDERLSEDLRLLYVALTRARHAIWMGAAPLVAGNARHCELHKGAVGYLLAGGQPVPTAELPTALATWRGTCDAIALSPAPSAHDDSLPRQAAPTPGAARIPVARVRTPWWIASYSALRIADPDTGALPSLSDLPEVQDTLERTPAEPATPQEARLRESAHPVPPTVPLATPGAVPEIEAGSPHAFPRGAAPGSFLHGLLEWMAEQGYAQVVASPALLRDTVARRCTLRGWTEWIDPLVTWLLRLATTPLPLPDTGASPPVALAALPSSQSEMEFWFSASHVDAVRLDEWVTRYTLQDTPRPRVRPDQLNGLLKGFIDLVFEHEGRYYVADYKSNWLGPDDSAYSQPAMRLAMAEHRYDLQYSLYLFALHRLLRVRLPDYDYDRHVGGAVYLFMRGIGAPGQGVYADKPPRALMDALDALFQGQETPTP